MDKQYKPLNSGEVLSINEAVQFLIGHSTFRSGEFLKAFKEQLLEYNIGGLTEDKGTWFTDDGIECEVLKFGSSGWQRGRVRINLEFCPDEDGQETTEQITAKTSQAPVPKVEEKPAVPPDEGFDLGESFVLEAETTIAFAEEEDFDFDLTETEDDLDLEGFTAESEPTTTEEEDFDFDLDLGEDFGETSDLSDTTNAETELDLEDPFAVPTDTSDEDDFDLGAFGAEIESATSADTLTSSDDDLGEDLDFDLGLSDENGEDDLAELEELDSNEDFSFDDFDLGEEAEEDIWKDPNSLS